METSRNNGYMKFCKFFLIRYKNWINDPLTLCSEYLPDDGDEKEFQKDHISLPAYAQAYIHWLESEDYQNNAEVNNITRELAEAQHAHRIWQKAHDDDHTLLEEERPNYPDAHWMEINNFSKIYSAFQDTDAPPRTTPWDVPNNHIYLPPDKIIQGKTFIEDESKIEHDETSTDAVDVSHLAEEQKIAYRTVYDHFEKKEKQPLHMILHGTAGTGKSYILKALKHIIKDAFHITATTGLAASLINGCTIHRKLRLPVKEYQKHDLTKISLVSLQEHFAKYRNNPSQCYIVIDEMSQLSHESIYWIHSRAKQAFNSFDDFGGMSIILVGDYGQLPPVFGTPLFSNESRNPYESDGYALYKRNFKTAINLRRNYRANPLNLGTSQENIQEAKENAEFCKLLLRIRNAQTTYADYKKISTRFLSHNIKDEGFENAVHLYHRRSHASHRNIKKLFQLRQPIATFDAEHKPPSARNIDAREFSNLLGQFKCSIKSKVMLIKNLWQSANLVNGSMGEIWDIVYAKNIEPPALPLFVLVHFPNYSGPPFLDEFPKIVPITPQSFSFNHSTTHKLYERTQIPLMLAYGLTIHKAQGSEFNRCVADIGDKDPPKHPGLAFVALSRCRKLKHYLISDVDYARFTALVRYKLYKYRWYEENRLEKMFQELRMTKFQLPYDDTHFNNTDLLLTDNPLHFNFVSKKKKKKKRKKK